MRLAVWLFGVLVSCLPRRLRERHGSEMRELFAWQLAAARERDGKAVLLTALSGLFDVLLRLPREYARGLRALEKGEGVLFGSWGFEARQSVRSMVRQPATSALVIGMLALGIAANTVVFTLINGLFLRPLPWQEPDRLVYLNEAAPKWNLEFTGINYPDFELWRRNARAFESMGLYAAASFNVADGENVERLRGVEITHDLLNVLRVKPVLGRGFLAEEDRPGAARVALISSELWRTRYGGRDNVLGRTIRINSEAHTIVGVLPAEAGFPSQASVWVPVRGDPAQVWQSYNYDGLARLKPGVTLASARSDLARAHKPIWDERDNDHTVSPRIDFLQEHLVGEFRTLAIALAAGVAIVLLIACANVSAVMLARATAREQEIGIRRALGADAKRLARQLSLENAALSLIGSLLGVTLGTWSVRVLLTGLPEEAPAWLHFGVDLRTLGFGLAAAAFTTLVAALAPIVQATRASAKDALLVRTVRASVTRKQRRTLDVLVTAEIALACVLLIGGGLLQRAYQRLQQVDPGFNPDNTLVFRVSLPDARYADGEARKRFYGQALTQLRALPGVEHAGAVSCAPLTCHWGNFLEVEGAPPRSADQQDPVTLYRTASAGYDQAIGLTVLRGRFLQQSDERDGAPLVGVVNETFARTFFGTSDPLGRRMRVRSEQNPWITIVGLVRDIKHYGLEEPMRPGIYIPYALNASSSLALVLRTKDDPLAVVASARSAIRQLDPELPLYDLKTMNDMLGNSLALRRLYSWLLAVFAGVAAVLAVGGVYGVLSYVSSQRRREIGIRLALGAQRPFMLGLIIGHGARLALIGALLGGAGSFVMARLLSTLLFGVHPFDPLTYASVIGALVGTALLAAWITARRTLRVEPQLVLRE